LTALALVAVACTHQGQQQQAGETMAAGDSVKAQAIEFVADSVVEKTAVGDYKVCLEVPHSGNEQLDQAVVAFVSDVLDCGKMNDAKALMRHIIDSVKVEFDKSGKENSLVANGEMRLSWEALGSKIYENDAMMTYEVKNDQFGGGPHGQFIQMAQTFRKSDGKPLGWDVINNWDSPEMNKLVVDGLKKYFEMTSDDELREMLINVDDINHIQRPSSAPVFGPDGLTVRYQQYEIAPYVAGLPEFTIPYEKLKSMIAPELYNELVAK